MSILILIQILVSMALIYAIHSWIKEAIQKRKELKKIKSDLRILQTMKNEITEEDL